MSNASDYTIGWICAVKVEHVAACQFLDEEHRQLFAADVQDDNTYTLGRIGKHNVVIAALPKGEYGISSAASVARDMLRSFPCVRFGLMVGIAGGAPSPKHDIRLGDVVVSSPDGKLGGVIQYDHGKTIQDKKFCRTGLMNLPPRSLRTVLAKLETRHESDGHQIAAAIDAVMVKKPRLKKKYQRPDPREDLLYRSDHVHVIDGESCTTGCGHDAANIIPRTDRDADEDNNPAIHYGTIASGSMLMKDAILRDTLAQDENILCFEMEAAGLMNHFPCLVIRGICDYADTHKNDSWQGYAAMTAAAYAKELLEVISPLNVEKEKLITEYLTALNENVTYMHSDTKETKSIVHKLSLDNHQRKVMNWLSTVDPSTNYNEASRKCSDGTGGWFLHGEEYSRWMDKPRSFLWLFGIPGCGKTILSSSIIKDILKRDFVQQSLLYFYFVFNDSEKQTLDSMLRSLTSQLYHKQSRPQHIIDQLFANHGNGNQQPRLEALIASLDLMLAETGDIFIVLDALDESREREDLLKWITHVGRSQPGGLKLLVTSRDEEDIRAELSKIAHVGEMVSLQRSLIDRDISVYVKERVYKDEGLKRWRGHPEVQDEIATTLMKKSHGMFRWAACQLDALEKCLNRSALRRALTSLPRTLDDTYARILASIPEDHRQEAVTLLQFLIWSERPLLLEEAVDAITVKLDVTPGFDPQERLPLPNEILKICSSLVTSIMNDAEFHAATGLSDVSDARSDVLDPATTSILRMELQLAHFSVKEYLTSNRVQGEYQGLFDEVSAKSSIVQICLTYISCLDHNLPLLEVKQKFPLAHYSARYWMNHAEVITEVNNGAQEIIMNFFLKQGAGYTTCYSLWDPERWWDDHPYDEKIEELPNPLHLAATFNLIYCVENLIASGADVNANIQNSIFETALIAASGCGHKDIVDILLQNGADVNAIRQNGYHYTALIVASGRGHKDIVDILLQNGADVNANTQNCIFKTALMEASRCGHKDIVDILLQNGADVNANTQNLIFNTALMEASESGHKDIVDILLQNGADVNAIRQNGYPHTALATASGHGHKDIVDVLLQNGADVNAIAQNGYHYTALIAASGRGYKDIVDVLLQNGADVNVVTQTGNYSRALFAAAGRGHKDIVDILLQNGAIVNANTQDGDYCRAIFTAVIRGHKDIVDILQRAAGVSTNVEASEYGTALIAATEGG